VSSHRRIVVGIGNRDAMPVVRWAAELAHSGDAVLVVHAYAPMPYAAADWTLPVEANDVMHSAAARHVAYAARNLRAQRHDLVVEAAIRTGSPGRVLLQYAAAAELLVIGTPHQTGLRTALATLASTRTCPVLVVGTMPSTARLPHPPITAVLRDLEADRQVIDVAMAEAARLRSPLVVLRPRSGSDGSRIPAREPDTVAQLHPIRVTIAPCVLGRSGVG
jgi:nucleotide-binding universal stress UspA family protein